MTSATFPRRQTRIAAATAALAAALVLTAGCGADGGGDGDSDASAGTTAPPTASADTGGGSGDSTAAAGDLEGNWLATKDGKAVALVVTGQDAGLFSTSGSVCSGSAKETSGMRMIALKCSDGNEDRAEGMVDSVDSTTLKITWEGFGKETYTRSEGEGLPSGLPTASLGS
ncbi:hypothetical protein QFZ75_004276 [Streptomyces sp. V3I8]|uniref:hypothetical protein n=1 Tax=Streptomyces sp. V3I8 TaxID=3042279 RepID=UPI002788C806|nr:hypothetical protein [Streptomyces sp. V3I8]MDQ1037860.1 hypothetical protein [Streptomyces sp. V3I8]